MKRDRRGDITSFFAPRSTGSSKGAEREEEVICPYCSGHFLPAAIQDHVDNHITLEDNEAKARKGQVFAPATQAPIPCSTSVSTLPPRENAFARMLTSSQLLVPRKAIFSLWLQEGKLNPSFILLGEENVDKYKEGDTIVPAEGAERDGAGRTAFQNAYDDGRNCKRDGWVDDKVMWTSAVRVKGIPCKGTKRDFVIELKSNLASATYTDSTASPQVIGTSLLKSMIQKAVRRKKIAACRLAFELLQHAPGELLRRLPIIIVEDSALHPAFPILVWCMLADTKGFVMPPLLVSVLMQITLEVTLCPYRDSFHQTQSLSSSGSVESSLEDDVLSLGSLPPNSTRCLIMSLLIRAAFGGMMGDMTMLQRAAVCWRTRFDGMDDSALEDIDSATRLDQNDLYCQTYLHTTYINGIFNGGNYYWHKRLLLRFSRSSLNEHADTLETLDRLTKCVLTEPAGGMERIQVAYKLIRDDLIPEGVDFHCDFNLTTHIIDKLRKCLSEEEAKRFDQVGPFTFFVSLFCRQV